MSAPASVLVCLDGELVANFFPTCFRLDRERFRRIHRRSDISHLGDNPRLAGYRGETRINITLGRVRLDDTMSRLQLDISIIGFQSGAATDHADAHIPDYRS